MILVDSSVWIDYFNGKISHQTDFLDQSLGTQLVATGELILTEVLQSFRQDVDYVQAKSLMLSLEQLAMVNQPIALKSAENYRFLRQRGITIRKTIKVMIATFCIEQNLALLHDDKDFQPFETYLGLKSALP